MKRIIIIDYRYLPYDNNNNNNNNNNRSTFFLFNMLQKVGT